MFQEADICEPHKQILLPFDFSISLGQRDSKREISEWRTFRHGVFISLVSLLLSKKETVSFLNLKEQEEGVGN